MRPTMSTPTGIVVALVTCPTKAVARRLGTAVIRHHLAACVNIIPAVESIFFWKGRVERCPETLLVIKTTKRRFESLRRAVLKWHPYDVPEIIALPVTLGSAPYLNWVIASTRPS